MSNEISRDIDPSPNLVDLYPVCIDRGSGTTVWDTEGRAYLDFLAGYCACNLGHGNPRMVKAISEQAARLALIPRVFDHTGFTPYLRHLTQFSGYEKAVLMNSGAEAVETAIKAARRWGYRVKGIPENQAEVICFTDNFHGRTLGMISMSATASARDDFGPLMPGFRVVDYGDLQAVVAAIGPNTCAILVEPVQGRGGVVFPPDGFLRGLRTLCDANQVLLLCDEVQSGLGRTGYRFAHEYEGIRADGVALGKSLSAGFYPISAFLADGELLDMFTPGSHGSTFGGNALACAIAEAALSEFEERSLIERAHTLGGYVLSRLADFDHYPVRAIRARGLWFALEIDPAAGKARTYCERLIEAGLLCDATAGNSIRFSPPLTVSEEELDRAFAIMHTVLG